MGGGWRHLQLGTAMCKKYANSLLSHGLVMGLLNFRYLCAELFSKYNSIL